MHVACHLSENLKDYGSLAAFWGYSFEWYNGTLESINTSCDHQECYKESPSVYHHPLECILLSSVVAVEQDTTSQRLQIHVITMCIQ